MDPPEWFKAFICCEALFQMPFFPIAAYAFLKGQWTQRPCVKSVEYEGSLSVCVYTSVCLMLHCSLRNTHINTNSCGFGFVTSYNCIQFIFSIKLNYLSTLIAYGSQLPSCTASTRSSEQVDCEQILILFWDILANTVRLVGLKVICSLEEVIICHVYVVAYFTVERARIKLRVFLMEFGVSLVCTGGGTALNRPGRKLAQTWPLLDFFCRNTTEQQVRCTGEINKRTVPCGYVWLTL